MSTPTFTGGVSYGGAYDPRSATGQVPDFRVRFLESYLKGQQRNVAEYKLNLTPEQEAALAAAIQRWHDSHAPFTEFSNNGAGTVLDLLRQVPGLSVPRYRLNTPARIEHWIEGKPFVKSKVIYLPVP